MEFSSRSSSTAFFVCGIIYPLYANWVWGGGWLSQLGNNFGLGHGHVDFAGSSVVHMTGGVCAWPVPWSSVRASASSTRTAHRTRSPATTSRWRWSACFILAFGWFGFNAGSTLAGTDLRIAVVAVNTMLARRSRRLFSSMLYMWVRYGKPDISMIANGMLPAWSPSPRPAPSSTAPVAVLIGAIAGVLVTLSVFFFERVAKIDDPVGAISVHGVNGAWGVLALGLFADGTYGDGFNGVKGTVKGLFYGDASQFVAQCIGTLTNIVYVFIISWVSSRSWTRSVGLRVPKDMELEGLDQGEVSVTAYPDFNLRHLPMGGGYYPHKPEGEK